MQDIDFDEIDRAVSSVSTSGKKDDDTSVAVTVNSTPAPTPSSTPVAPRPTSGRFMDLVQPGSRSSSALPPRETKVPEREEPKEAPKEEHTWPDPIDLPGTHSDLSPTEPEEKEEEPAPVALESPFLSDAKVEKRPLGAFSDAAPEEPTPEAKPGEKEELSNDEINTPLPTELHDDLMELESTPVESETPEPAESAKPAEEAPVGPTSITQQYKEQPSTTDQPSGAIFDTEAYHQPLAHPVKKKSGALTIVWILSIIIVGGGAGAAVYFFVLPML